MVQTRSQSGFAYLVVLVIIGVMSIFLSGGLSLWHLERKREKERQFLDAGNSIRQAIRAYYIDAPSALQAYPQSLHDLVRDPRMPGVRRYLRKIPFDPLHQSYDWGLIHTYNGFISGVYSKASGTPLKKGNFVNIEDAPFNNAHSYSDWKFVFVPNERPGFRAY